MLYYILEKEMSWKKETTTEFLWFLSLNIHSIINSELSRSKLFYWYLSCQCFCRILLKKSGSRTPRVELEDMGPSVDFSVRRTKIASDDLYSRSLKKPKTATVRILAEAVICGAFGFCFSSSLDGYVVEYPKICKVSRNVCNLY